MHFATYFVVIRKRLNGCKNGCNTGTTLKLNAMIIVYTLIYVGEEEVIVPQDVADPLKCSLLCSYHKAANYLKESRFRVSFHDWQADQHQCSLGTS